MNKIKSLWIFVMLMLISATGFSQDPGGSPDGPPPAVPIEDYMNLILLAIGILFSLFAIKKLQRKNA